MNKKTAFLIISTSKFCFFVSLISLFLLSPLVVAEELSLFGDDISLFFDTAALRFQSVSGSDPAKPLLYEDTVKGLNSFTTVDINGKNYLLHKKGKIKKVVKDGGAIGALLKLKKLIIEKSISIERPSGRSQEKMNLLYKIHNPVRKVIKVGLKVTVMMNFYDNPLGVRLPGFGVTQNETVLDNGLPEKWYWIRDTTSLQDSIECKFTHDGYQVPNRIGFYPISKVLGNNWDVVSESSPLTGPVACVLYFEDLLIGPNETINFKIDLSTYAAEVIRGEPFSLIVSDVDAASGNLGSLVCFDYFTEKNIVAPSPLFQINHSAALLRMDSIYYGSKPANRLLGRIVSHEKVDNHPSGTYHRSFYFFPITSTIKKFPLQIQISDNIGENRIITKINKEISIDAPAGQKQELHVDKEQKSNFISQIDKSLTETDIQMEKIKNYLSEENSVKKVDEEAMSSLLYSYSNRLELANQLQISIDAFLAQTIKSHPFFQRKEEVWQTLEEVYGVINGKTISRKNLMALLATTSDDPMGKLTEPIVKSYRGHLDKLNNMLTSYSTPSDLENSDILNEGEDSNPKDEKESYTPKNKPEKDLELDDGSLIEIEL